MTAFQNQRSLLFLRQKIIFHNVFSSTSVPKDRLNVDPLRTEFLDVNIKQIDTHF